MATALRFCRGMIYNYNQNGRASEFLKMLYEFWGYAVNGTSALQTPGGMSTTSSLNYSISNTTGAGTSPIVVTTTTTNALFTGQQVSINGVLGNTAANGIYQITVITGSTFSLNSTTGNGGYTGGGTVNTTPFAWSTNFTEGNTVLAVGNDGYTAAQISTTFTGDAIFTALNSNPFTSTATSFTVTNASNFQTTIASGSNGQSLPQSTINVATTTPISTTITASSNNVSLPTGTINVVSTVGFPSAGYINIATTEGTVQVLYTGTTATTFTGCTFGIGTMFTGGAVSISFPASGTINVTTGAGNQVVTYTGITGTTFTGCTGGTGTMSTGGAVSATIQLTLNSSNSYNNLQSVVVNGVLGNTSANGVSTGGTQVVSIPTYNVSTANFFNTSIAFPSNGLSLPQTTINSSTAAPFTTTSGIQTLPTSTVNVTATATASTTILAASNGSTLPQTTVNATSTTGFPTTGTISVFATPFTSVTVPSNLLTLPQSTINVGSTAGFPTTGNLLVGTSTTTTIAVGSNGQTLPQGTINVAATTGFPTSGNIFVTTANGPQIVAYTGTTGTTFTGCTGGTGTMSTGGAVALATSVAYTGITGVSFTGCTGGTGTMLTNSSVAPPSPVAQTVTYTGVTSTTFTGCLGGVGLMQSGNTINNNGFFTNFPTTGTVYIVTTTGTQPVSYTGTTATTLTGCTNGTGNTSAGGSVFTAFSPASNYTSITAGSNGASLPQSTINVSSTTGFPTSGYVYVTTSTGFQVVTYTGTTGTTFTGCTGGTGTMSTGNAVVICYPPTGTFNVVSTQGTQTVAYTATTPTTFTGGTGGIGTISTGSIMSSPVQVTTTTGTTLTTNQFSVTSGIGGLNGANGIFTVTRIDNRNFSLNSTVPSGTYTSGGIINDRTNLTIINSIPNGAWTSGGTQTVSTINMVGKLFVMWQPNSGTSEDGIYTISSVVNSNTIRININTGGTPDPITLHPSFNQRSNINYRVVEVGLAQNASSGNGNYMVMQFNPSSISLNPGQANSQVQIFGNDSAGTIGMNMSPGGNWNGVAFPVTGNIQTDATGQFTSQSGNLFNGSPATTMAVTMAADPGFFWMHFKDVNSGDGSSYIHVEIPTRLYPSASDTNPMVALNRGGVFNGSVYVITNSNAGGNISRGFLMKGTDGAVRTHYALSKSLFGDGTPNFGTQLTDVRLAFNTIRGTVLASDCVLSLPAVTNQYSLGRVKLRTIKFTSTPLPGFHRFGTAGGPQFINVQNGIAIIWDNTIIPQNLFFIL